MNNIKIQNCNNLLHYESFGQKNRYFEGTKIQLIFRYIM